MQLFERPNTARLAVLFSTCLVVGIGTAAVLRVATPGAAPAAVASDIGHATMPTVQDTLNIGSVSDLHDVTLSRDAPFAMAAATRTIAPEPLLPPLPYRAEGPSVVPTPRPSAVTEQLATTPTAVAVSLRPTARPAVNAAELAIAVTSTNLVVQASADVLNTTQSSRSARGSNICDADLTENMPGRPRNAAAGSVVMAGLAGAGGATRDDAIVAQALSGNIPDHLRTLRPVTFTGLIGGRETEITVCVTSDYLSVGSTEDHVRVPLGLPAALHIADRFDMMLPTTRIVDAIFAQADLRVAPSPMTPGAQMTSTSYFVQHNATVDGQMAAAGGAHGLLVAGHKKDVVIANRLARMQGRVAIYGWHRPSGNPIQPLSTVHGAYYADYSHGIRLVSRTAYRNGQPVDLRALLTDGQYAGMLNSDGPMSASMMQLAAAQ